MTWNPSCLLMAVSVHAIVDGQACDLPDGTSVLTAIRSVGSHVPTLCHDERLVPTGACRSCLVSIEGSARWVPACSTPLVDGMAISTRSAALDQHRRLLLGLLAARYPASAVAEAPDKEFHQALREHDLSGAAVANPDLVDRSHPYIVADMSRCIDCYRCVRICDEVQGQHVWHVRNRGIDTRVVPDGPSLADSSCVACGACVDTCPTGALEDATAGSGADPTQWTRTTCPYCGTGCEMSVGTRDGRIVAVRPVLEAPVSKGHLCVKGRYAFGFVHAVDRVTEPMLRDGGRWRTVSWQEATREVAARLRGIVDRHGPDSIGLLGSARATNEDNYLVQKFARTVLGTNNVDCCARVCHAPSAAALKDMFGAGLSTNSFDDLERARTILVCGANPTEDHPIVGARIRQAARRGAQLIVIDPRRIELAADSACHVALRPGTNVALLNAMAHVIVFENLCDRTFLDTRVEGFDQFVAFIRRWTPARAARVCRVEPDTIRYAARLYATQKPAMMFHGLGLTEHVQGTDGVMALSNLALLTGNIGVPGGGVNPLRGQNNVQGAAHMGCDPGVLPGSTPLRAGRDTFERVWGARVPETKGLSLMEMMEAAAVGRMKALWAIGYDVFFTNPNATHTADALRSLDLVIVQDLFLTETARVFGNVFLPACSSFEKEGTFMNAERRIQRVRAAVPPVGHSRPDWWIVAQVAQAMGAPGFNIKSPEDVWHEVRELCPGARGMSYARLEQGGLQWPCVDEDHPGSPILHERTFTSGGRARLRCLDQHTPAERVSERFPLLLITGRTLYHFNAGTMTGRTSNLALHPVDVLDISPIDAGEYGVQDGERVRLVSRYGAVELAARFSVTVNPGQVFTTFHSPQVFINLITSPHGDTAVGTPEYKVTAVRIERLTSSTAGRPN